MTLCYDFQKWTIISLALVAVSLTVGLVLINFAHGQGAADSSDSEDCCFYVMDLTGQNVSN